MLLIPAIDLKDGHCVRLKQGDMDQSTTFGEDPAAMARKWVDAGARRLHLVDLNGAFEGRPANAPAVEAILTTNIVRADTLADAQVIELVAYQPRPAGTFVREWSTLEESESDSQLDLFATLPDELQRDAVPVHYTQLAANPKPTAAKGRKR